MKNLFYKALPVVLLLLVAGCDEKKKAGSSMQEPTAKPVINKTGYTCPMHPQVHSDTAGACPICGMNLEPVKSPGREKEVSLNTLLKPVNQQVVASVPMVHMAARTEDIEMDAYGFLTYDTRYTGAVSANVNGRIEKLYVKYRYQEIKQGQKIMDIYSPELMTAQENLLFVLKNDRDNEVLIDGAKQKLLLLGMSEAQLQQVMQSERAVNAISVYSRYSGHIHESDNAAGANNESLAAKDLLMTTQELPVKEGMYVQKGENVFSVYDPAKAWAVLNIFAGQAALIHTGDKVRVIPEVAPQKDFRAVINYIEPFYREGSKTLTARVYFDNRQLRLPIGSQVKATVFAGQRLADWLPEEAVLSLGLDKIVFVRNGESFVARKIETGIVNKHLVQVVGGLDKNEAVVANAQYLVDSESFIKTNK
ncbi:MAG: efflux RND transporter periplasmic adaptor subunit [Bacteroidota bacterium]|nr:efflux RND transporter periplasmic adaptor subunit [Bacteroidota bacterium]